MSILLGVLGAIGAALVGAFAYTYQRNQDRRFEVIQERRELYVEYVKTVTPSLYRHVLTRSQEHHSRLESLNSIGSALQVIAPRSVLDAHSEFINHLRSQTRHADPDTGEHPAFFDDEAERLLDMVLEEMRKDALPRDLYEEEGYQ